MICLHGKTVCGGMVSGEAFVFSRSTGCKNAENVSVCTDDELHRLELAVSAVREELVERAEQAEKNTAKEIFEIHRMMLEDEDILDSLYTAVKDDGTTAETAVSQTEQYFSQLFRDTQDDYMIARIDDIRDICGRLKAFLTAGELSAKPQRPVILVADELLPSDLAEIGKENIKGIVMGSGTIFSHTSILIKEMCIPALICENTGAVKMGVPVLLNADSGTAYFEPDGKTSENFKRAEKLADEKKADSPFRKFAGEMYVNIGNPSEATEALFEKCDGIGLFRTEYLYLGRTDLPDEEEQFSIYSDILKKAGGKSVTIRTFDIGSDKSAEALPLKKEENPALGFRGLRVYSLYPEVFKIQLKALLRAAVYGNLRIMYPMVTSVEEINRIKQMLSQVEKELKQQGIPYKLPPQGAMIETPSAALLSDEIAKTVDFFSVGTNDLTQYTLALDRQDGHLDAFCDHSYKAVMSLIDTAAKNAHKNGIKIGICGELASQPEFIGRWIEMDIDYLSVSPSIIR